MTSFMDRNTADLESCTSLVPIDNQFAQGIKTILHSAVKRLQLINAVAMLRGINNENSRYLIIGEQLPGPEALARAEEEEFFISTELPMAPHSGNRQNQESVSLALNFNSHRLGYLVASLRTSEITSDNLHHGLEQTAAELLSFIKRYQTRHKMLRTFGPQPYWIGCSKSLRQLDQMIDKLADAPMPVVIRGDKGTGKLMAARALHCHAHADFRPFIESSCEDWEPGATARILAELWAYARGGTLFLRNIDQLPRESFVQLQDFWRNKSLNDTSAACEVKARLLVSLSSSEPFNIAENNPVAQWLEFNFLDFRLPALSERRADIRTLSRYFIDEYHLDVDFDFSEDAWQLLESFHWPENVQQLKRLIQKLAILVDEPWINAVQLLQLFPSLELHEPTVAAKLRLIPEVDATATLENVPVSPATIFGGSRDLKWEHPLLINAVTFMIDNHQRDIDVLDAAGSTGITATQLAELLKHRLGLSFNQVMNKIRIERAKTIFQKAPSRQIDQICREVGFADIDGFEKIFKRMVGISPKVYRGQFFKPLSLVRQ